MPELKTKVRPEDGVIECRGCGDIVATYPETDSQPPERAREAAAIHIQHCMEAN